ncbi:MAG: hypothetical protein ACLUE2_07915 [Bacteroides cellulosilyticus]
MPELIIRNVTNAYAYATNSTTADPWLYLYRWDSTYPIGYDENGNEMRSPASKFIRRTLQTKRIIT